MSFYSFGQQNIMYTPSTGYFQRMYGHETYMWIWLTIIKIDYQKSYCWFIDFLLPTKYLSQMENALSFTVHCGHNKCEDIYNRDVDGTL